MAHFVTELEDFDEHLISEEQVLQASGETRLEAVSQLIIRGQAATGLQAQCAARLAGHLSVLSLSNNALQSMQSLHSMVNLVELNLNFNAISSLAELACPSLRRLFLSSNRMTSLAGISSFPKLVTLCLYRNQLADLAAALSALRQLLKLRELDLDGNPCSSEAAYKHQILRSLPKLEQLDGEVLTSLDTDLSQLYYAECNEQTDAATVTTGRTRVLRCEKLNDDPILLSYLADETLEHPHTSHSAALQASSGSSTADHAVTASSRGFVARLRSTGAMPLTEATAAVQASSILSSDAPVVPTAVQLPPPLPQPPVGGACAASDPSNPHATIRRLLQLVEMLQRERDEAYAGTGMIATSSTDSSAAAANVRSGDQHYYGDDAGSSDSDSASSSCSEAAAASTTAKSQREHQRSSSSRQSVQSREVVNVAALLQEVQRLRLENQNMGVLLEENRSLRAELAATKADSAAQCDALAAQVMRLQLQLAEATDNLQAAADVAADVALGSDTPRSCLSGAALAAEVRLFCPAYYTTKPLLSGTKE
jgi:hypothetical protein